MINRRGLAVVCAAVGVARAVQAAECPRRDAWPTAGWTNRVEETKAAKPAEVEALEHYAFVLTGLEARTEPGRALPADIERIRYRTDGLVVIKGGALIYENYARGYGPDTKHLSWSVAKSISSSLLGVALHRGALSLDDSICKHLPEYADHASCAITVKHVLTFGTGLAWQEGYEDGVYSASSVISMFFGVGHRDHLAHILGHRLAAPPGTAWTYSTGDAELASAIAKRALHHLSPAADFWSTLFDRIGMGVTFEEDAKGTPNGGSHVFATPRDFAKFGFLMLNDGCWDGQRILPETWVKDATTPSEVFSADANPRNTVASGYMWWLNRAVRDNPQPWPDAPSDTYSAIGHWGQVIIVIPSEDLVIVRTGDDRQTAFSKNTLAKLTLAVTR
jgi:CubicO group peptidase (beta-lactamase class C family)